MGTGGARGIPFVVSGPSGAGKTTLVRALLGAVSGLEFSVSYTTRPQRAGEVDGKDYHFIDDARFDEMVAGGGLLEWAHVHGRRYGTGRRATDQALARGDLLLDVDVQGARQLSESGVGEVSIFILPPDFAILEQRLRQRSSEDEGALARRLAAAAHEAAEFQRYDYLVVNDGLDRAVEELCSIVRSERRRVARCGHQAEQMLANWQRGVKS